MVRGDQTRQIVLEQISKGTTLSYACSVAGVVGVVWKNDAGLREAFAKGIALKKQLILDALASGMTIEKARAAVARRTKGVTPFKDWRRSDPAFAVALSAYDRRKQMKIRLRQSEKPETLTQFQDLAARKIETLEQEYQKRRDLAQEVGDYYREIACNYSDWCKLPVYPIVRPKSLPRE